MRSIGVVTGARSDYGVYRPILRKIQADPELKLLLFVCGAHLLPQYGMTVKEIEADGFPIAERVEMLLPSDTPEAVAESMGRGTAGFARAFARTRPDILLVVGDRFEMHAAVVAALPFNIPVAHIAGGELTEGAIDDSLRHSITKLSHLHFTQTQEYAERVLRLGEEAWRVTVCGSPSLDNLRALKLLSAAELEQRLGVRLGKAFLLVTYHPVTLEMEDTARQIGELLAALEAVAMPAVFTMPNADPANATIRGAVQQYAAGRANAWALENLGTEMYFSMMALAAAMVGNSSSGIIEAPSFRLPVVNIGTRQRGRVRGQNVLDVGYGREEIAAGIRRALSPEFRASLRDSRSPYGESGASARIVERLKSVPLDARLIRKRFHQPGHEVPSGRGRER